MSKKFEALYDKYLIRSANSIYNDEYRHFLMESGFVERLLTTEFSNIDRQDEFLDFYPQWILSSQLNTFRGLESFPYQYISLGCTQGLDEFHYWCARNKKRIRMFRGEYPYNRDCISFDWSQDFIEDSDLIEGDAVIISLPFSGSGQIHPRWEELKELCLKRNIPIFVDCAFFGTCFGIELDLDHPAIQGVAFSTTKSLSCGNYRNGIVFSRVNESHLSVQTEWHHGIHFNVSVGLELMKNFRPDHLVNKYRTSYEEVCSFYGLMTTNCIHLALGDGEWGHFSRDEAYNRIGVKNAVRDHWKDRKKFHALQPV